MIASPTSPTSAETAGIADRGCATSFIGLAKPKPQVQGEKKETSASYGARFPEG